MNSLIKLNVFRYFKNFRYCSYVPHATKCQPLSDGELTKIEHSTNQIKFPFDLHKSFVITTGVSSFSDLISHRVHRAFLWIIGVLTIVGNALVLGGRNLAKTENRILAMFVKNLAG